MRLIKTAAYETEHGSFLELHDVSEEELKKDGNAYAILSHTWGALPQEVLFSDIVRQSDVDILDRKRVLSVDMRQEPAAWLVSKDGFRKIDASLKQAKRDGLPWFWADTLCIDKSSSSELSEAINSMFSWYRKAAICYVYLQDVTSVDPPERRRHSFSNSKWFTRGWTLQELLAPRDVVFWSREWSPLGNKRSLAEPLSRITKIDVTVLGNSSLIFDQCVAKRMSWAANRQTSRPEDRAYSLLGLFGINMPMLYGERENAFHRLQQEIMRSTDDTSIFAWVDPTVGDVQHGLLADRPEAFAHASSFRHYGEFDEREPFVMSNRGLNIHLPLTLIDRDLFAAALHCPNPKTLDGYLAIYLRKLPTGDREYARVRCGQFAALSARGNLRRVFVRASFGPEDSWQNVMPLHLFYLAATNMVHNSVVRYSFVDVISTPLDSHELSRHRIQAETYIHLPEGARSTFKMIRAPNHVAAAILYRRIADDKRFALLLGTGTSFDPAWDIVETYTLESLDHYNSIFRPRALGSKAQTASHGIMVEAKTKVWLDVKIYMVEVNIQAIEYRTGDRKDSIDEVRAQSGTNPIGRLKQLLRK